MKTVFGPVPSRRLGRSLGVDVIPPKTCTYDCIYCESGPTTRLSLERQAFVAPDRVIADLEAYFADHPQGADVLTFSSAGEPTLYEPLGELIRTLKRRFKSLPLMVLTNGSLFWDARVRSDLMAADRVVPSMDAALLDAFRKINRPHPALDLERIVEGLHAFRREYRGELHLEILLVSGMNDRPEQLAALRRLVDTLCPDRIELNTVVRPPAYAGIRGLDAAEMDAAARFFPDEKTCVIGQFKGLQGTGGSLDLESRILEMVQRRPCTASELAGSLQAAAEEVDAVLQRLEREARLTSRCFGGRVYLVSGGPDAEPEPTHPTPDPKG